MALNVTAGDYDAALDRAERDLVELARCLDRPVPREMYETALLVLGHRARTLYNGLVALVQTEARAASVALIRPAVEINLIARFLVASPELHSELWVAEGERQNACGFLWTGDTRFSLLAGRVWRGPWMAAPLTARTR